MSSSALLGSLLGVLGGGVVEVVFIFKLVFQRCVLRFRISYLLVPRLEHTLECVG